MLEYWYIERSLLPLFDCLFWAPTHRDPSKAGSTFKTDWRHWRSDDADEHGGDDKSC